MVLNAIINSNILLHKQREQDSGNLPIGTKLYCEMYQNHSGQILAGFNFNF